jgi:NlpC/P60 family
MAPSRSLRRLAAVSLSAALALVAHASVADARGPAEQAAVGGEQPLRRAATTRRAVDEVTLADVPAEFWAADAIRYVADRHDWMRDAPTRDGTFLFQPLRLEPRRLFARTLVRAFARGEPVDDSLTIADVRHGNPFFSAANVAVKLGWMRTDDEGKFRPTDPVTTLEVHEALVAALGLGDLARAAGQIHVKDGTAFDVPDGFGALLIGMRIGLRYDHADDFLDVSPASPLPRSEVAWSLNRAATLPSWMAASLAPYADVELPNLGPVARAIVRWSIDSIGSPYVSGGEWDRPTPPGYCCGAQPVGGFDCSGLTWWLMRAADAGWDNSPPRPYAGWALPQRTSAGMAAGGPRVRWDDLRPADLMFYDADADGRVDHVDTYVGNGWAIDSSSSLGGVTIMWVGTGWYADHFVHGRRIIGNSGR